VRRFMLAILAGSAVVSTPLVAQQGSAWAFGFAGTLGSNWQIEGADVGLEHYIHAGPFRATFIGARLGTFINEEDVVGGTQGFLGGLVASVRTGLWALADVGNETNPASLGLDLTIEAAGYAGTDSPLPQGSTWGSVGVFPGLSFGTGLNGPHYGIVFGPAAFLGRVTSVVGFLGLRFELPRARGGY